MPQNLSHRTPPPQWIEHIVSSILPHSRREQVLGDLKERCVEKQSYATLLYILDALTTLPHVWWSTARRSLVAPPLKLAGASDMAIRERTEKVATERRNRNLIYIFALLFTAVVRYIWHPAPSSFSSNPIGHWILGLAILLILITQPGVSPHQHKPKTMAIPTLFPAVEQTRVELIQAYRESIEVERKTLHDVMRPLRFYWPMMVLVEAFVPNWASIPRRNPRYFVIMVTLVAVYALSVYIGRREAHKLQQELDTLDEIDLSGTASPTHF